MCRSLVRVGSKGWCFRLKATHKWEVCWGAQCGLAMHWLPSLACVLAPAVYSQQDSGGLVSIWTTEWSAAWGDIQLQRARSSHTQMIKFTLHSFLPPRLRRCAPKRWYFPASVQRVEGDQRQCSRRLLYFSICLGDLCAGRGKRPWSIGILGYGGGRIEGEGSKSALLVFDPGQHCTRGHRTTAAVHLVERLTSACIILNHTPPV